MRTLLKKTILLLILLLLVGYVQAQELDDLKKSLNNIDYKKNPQEALSVLKKIYDVINVNQPQMSTEYIGRALFICDSILDDSVLATEWKEKLARLYLEQDKLDQAMRYIVEVRNFYKSTNDTLNYAYSLYDLGNLYYALNVPEIALEEYNKAIDIFEKKNDNKGLILTNIQKSKIIYDDYEISSSKAFQILFGLLDKAGNNVYLTANIYKNIGLLYSDEYEIDSANYYLLKAVEKFRDTNLYVYEADCYLDLGKLYFDDEDFETAEKYLNKANSIYEKNQTTHKYAETKNLLGYSAFLQNKFSIAENLFLQSLASASLFKNSEQALFSYQYLAKIYDQQKNYEKSKEYLNLYIEELNNRFEVVSQQGFAEIILTFQNEEKQKRIVLLEKEDALKSQSLKNKQQQIYGAILAMGLLVAFAFLLLFFVQRQKKANKLLNEQNRKINLQKKEIETQSRILEKATHDLVRQKDEIENKNKKITSSITYASRIQKSMLSLNQVFERYFSEHFVLFKPKETVSGDFYWISRIKEQKPTLFKKNEDHEKIIVAVVDCTGHGVPGAFMSMLGDAYLNQIVNIQHIYSPEKILEELHVAIRTTLKQAQTDNNDGMDVALCLINKVDKTLEYAGAKNPLVYVQNGEMHRINGNMNSIGGLQKEKIRVFDKHIVDITSKTYIYLYSDGFQDQFGGEYCRKYMAKPFRDLLFKNYKEPMDKQKELLLEELNKWKGKKQPQMDDITVVGFTL